MLLNPITLYLPTTTKEAAQLYRELPEAKVLAGGTFLLNSMKLLKSKGTKTAKHILSLAKVHELKGVSRVDDHLIIKAMTTINELFDTPLLTGQLIILKMVCRNISTNPIRNMATIGGNLTCRYTWTEMGAVMVALEARMHFMGPDGVEEMMNAEDFFINAARTDKLFTHVSIPCSPSFTAVYRRVKKTVHVDVPMMAVCIKTQLNGKQWQNTRVGINNCVAFAQRDIKLENFLNKQSSSLQLGTEALGHLTSNIYDVRSSEYKQHMFRVSIKSAIDEISQMSS